MVLPDGYVPVAIPRRDREVRMTAGWFVDFQGVFVKVIILLAALIISTTIQITAFVYLNILVI
jgi:hypothetical protein